MPNYIVIEKATAKDVYAYESHTVSNVEAYPLDLYDHITQQDEHPFELQPGDKATKWLIDIGPFFDRFGNAKYSILMSTDPLVRVIVEDVRVRKWVDLSRPDVSQAIDVLISKGLCSPAVKYEVLTAPVMPIEQMALMATYGEALNNAH